MAHRPRLDKKHGFLNHITRNQLDRRTYHEERQKEDVVKGREQYKSYGRSRDQQSKRAPEYMFKPDKDNVVFTLSVEYCPSKIAVLKVRQGDDPDRVAKEFTDKYGMREDLTVALSSIISQKMGK